jgi:integrase
MISLYVPENLLLIHLDRIDARDLDGLYDRLLTRGRRDGKGGLSPRTVRYVHTVLSRAFADGIRHGLLKANPAKGAYPPSPRAARSPVFPVWSAKELQRFLAFARDDPHYAAFRLAAMTGLRRSELLGLRWCDLDLERGQLQVLQTVVVIGREVCIGLPKTDRSRRLVAVDIETVTVLRAHRDALLARLGEVTSLDDETLVFTKAGGGAIHPVLFTYYFQRCAQAAGVRKIRFHDLRHTHATLALQAGIHPKIVSERLGHSSISITLDTYSHALPSMQTEAAETIAALLGRQ